MTTIDLENLTHEQNLKLNDIAKDIRSDYDRVVVNLSRDHIHNIHWIVGSIASRNKYSSPLFIRCCKIAFVKQAVSAPNFIGKILTNDRALANVMTKWCAENNLSNIVFLCREDILSRIWRILRPVRQYLIAIYLLCLRFFGSLFKKRDHSLIILLL